MLIFRYQGISLSNEVSYQVSIEQSRNIAAFELPFGEAHIFVTFLIY